MARKLTYFNTGGLGDSIRFILHYGDLEFEDVRIDHTKWPIAEVKDSLPFGQMPVYQEGDKVLNQSIAIARYVGQLAGLVPSDPWEQAQLDAMVLNIMDLGQKVSPYYRESDPAKKEQIKKELVEQTFPFFFSRFEKELVKGNGYFGAKLSWADFYLVGFVGSANTLLNVQVEKGFPKIEAVVQKIRGLPRVKEYYDRTSVKK